MHPAARSSRSTTVKSLVRTVAFAFLVTASLRAHDPGLSTTQIELGKDGVRATVGFAPADIRTLLPRSVGASGATWTEADLNGALPVLRELSVKLVEMRDEKGLVPWTENSVSLASGNSVIFKLSSSRMPEGHVELRSLVLQRLPPGHRDYISIVDGTGALVLEKLAGSDDPPVSIVLAPPVAHSGPHDTADAEPPTFWGFLRLGVAHIWTGYDHLLFLFGLLLVCRSFRSIVGIISCFTVAHSITLALATLNIVNLPSALVEPMIAASIVYVGVENLVRKGAEPKGRWALTFGFGLIHGFGFASVLRELGIGSNGHGLAMPLFTFNLGVEVGQITIAAIVLPVVWQLRKNPTFVRRGVPVLSGVVALAGLYWFLQRTIF
jgi:hydrogenase/urease accessory protein HupE